MVKVRVEEPEGEPGRGDCTKDDVAEKLKKVPEVCRRREQVVCEADEILYHTRQEVDE